MGEQTIYDYSSRTIERTLFILIVHGTIRVPFSLKNIFLILDSIKDHNGSLTRDSKICIPSTQTFRLRRNFLETIN